MPVEGPGRMGMRSVVVAIGLMAAAVLFVLPQSRPTPVGLPDRSTTVPAPVTSSPPTTEADRSVAIPVDGFATLGPDGIRGSHRLLIWNDRGTGRGRIIRDGEGGLVFSERGAIWWLRPGASGPELVEDVAGDPIEVLSTEGDPVVRVGQCPSTLIQLADGSRVAEAVGLGPRDLLDGRIDIDCESGLVRWRSENGLSAWLEPPDAEGRIWLMVLEFDLTVARVPVSTPIHQSVRIEDFDGRFVLLSRAEEDRADERSFLVLDLVSASVEDITGHLAGSAVLLGPDVRTRPEYWGPSQSLDDARRDGVPEDLAMIPLGLRSDPTGVAGRPLSRQTPEGEWRASRPSGYSSLCGCHPEYGELLLVSDGGQVLKAYPTPGAPLTWLAVEGDHVYAGKIGDGALSDSVLARIDRVTLEATVVVFQVEERYERDWPDGWDVVDWGSPLWEDYEEAIGVGEPIDGGIRVEPWIWVDFAKVDRLIDAASN